MRLIKKSLQTGGEALKLIADKPHASGWVDAVGAPDVHGDVEATARAVRMRGKQAIAVLRDRFEIAEPVKDFGAETLSFLSRKWPSSGNSEDYLTFHSANVRLAGELSLDDSPDGRKLWWHLVAGPPVDSPFLLWAFQCC